LKNEIEAHIKKIEYLYNVNEKLQATNNKLSDNEESYEKEAKRLRRLEGQLRSDINELETEQDELQATVHYLKRKVDNMRKTGNC
jgi:chromosome segregation ATPase